MKTPNKNFPVDPALMPSRTCDIKGKKVALF